MRCARAFYEHREVFAATFVQDNPQGFSAEDLALVASWKHWCTRAVLCLSASETVYRFFWMQIHPRKPMASWPSMTILPIMFPHVPILIETMLLPFQESDNV